MNNSRINRACLALLLLLNIQIVDILCDITVTSPVNSDLITYRFKLEIQLSEVPQHGTFKVLFLSKGGPAKDPVPKHAVTFKLTLENTKKNVFFFDLLTLLTLTKSNYIDSVYPMDENLRIGSIYDILIEYVPLGKPVMDKFKVQTTINNLKLVSAPEEDALQLESLWIELKGSKWHAKWDMNYELCPNKTYGIVCNEKGNIIELNLPSNNLEGKLPNDIGNFSFLKKLNMADNKLKEGFPMTIFNLENLEELNLSNNYLENNFMEIKDFSRRLLFLSKIKKFDISNNKIKSKVALDFKTIDQLNHLSDFRIAGNLMEGDLNKVAVSLKNNTDRVLLGVNNVFNCPIQNFAESNNNDLDFNSTSSCKSRVEVKTQTVIKEQKQK
eukprot:GAHX01000270.1.p1 GENE.GAHX01000270.1~~GAHX01000270.1.p1  ORF type:complete len:384 (+),score=71.47 GAHX01000270.1:61-1212(+)